MKTIDKMIEELNKKAENIHSMENNCPVGTYVVAIDKAIEIARKNRMPFHNYDLYCNLEDERDRLLLQKTELELANADLIEQNGNLKEELKTIKETSLNEKYWEVNELFKEECLKNVHLKEQLKNYENDGWILCSDRLPNKEECKKNSSQFIVTCESCLDDEPNWAELCVFDELADGYIDPKWCNSRIVIAWKPLPKPYKGE